MGVAIVAGRRIQVVGNTINDSVYYAVDLEPDASQPGPNGEAGHGGGFVDVLISDNDVTRYGWGTDMTSWFVAVRPAGRRRRHRRHGRPHDHRQPRPRRARRGRHGRATTALGGLGIRADKANLKRNFSDHGQLDGRRRRPPGLAAAVISLANVENLAVTGNRQPIANGAAFVRDAGTTGTRVVDANDVSP